MSSETVSFAQSVVKTQTVPGTGNAPLANQTKVALPAMAAPKRPQLPEQNAAQERAVAAQLDSYVRSSNRNLSFAIDPATRTPIVTVRDANGGVVRQIPDATKLRVAALLESGLGTMFDGRA